MLKQLILNTNMAARHAALVAKCSYSTGLADWRVFSSCFERLIANPPLSRLRNGTLVRAAGRKRRFILMYFVIIVLKPGISWKEDSIA